jgi:hypothetical protein
MIWFLRQRFIKVVSPDYDARKNVFWARAPDRGPRVMADVGRYGASVFYQAITRVNA